jgi:sulfatase maturation enzyme AslB (radical SAM superfamily)
LTGRPDIDLLGQRQRSRSRPCRRCPETRVCQACPETRHSGSAGVADLPLRRFKRRLRRARTGPADETGTDHQAVRLFARQISPPWAAARATPSRA